MISRKELINKIVLLKKRFGVSENYFLIFLAVLIGVLSSLGNWGLRFAIEFFHEYIFVAGSGLLGVGQGGWKFYLMPLLPMCGGLLLIPLLL